MAHLRRYALIVLLVLVTLISAACNRGDTPSTEPDRSTATAAGTTESANPSPSPSPQEPTDTPTPTQPPIAPSVTNTLVPPTEPATPAPSSLNSSGPYVVFKAQSGIWLTNPDGSLLTRITDLESHNDLRGAISAGGERLALVVRNEQGLDLVVMKIPGGEVENTIHLMSITRDEEINAPTSTKAFAAYAIRDYNSTAWQPGEGRTLAFMGAINGPTADLYVYDSQTQEITQLTDGSSQGILPSWSPDGQQLLHFGVSWVQPFGGAIGGANRLDGAWAVRIADGKVITMPKPLGFTPNFIDWQDDTHYLTYDSSETCFAQNLRSVDATSGEVSERKDFSFYYEVARSPENGALLFSSAAGCADSLGEGVFLLSPGQDTPNRLLEKRAYEIAWLPESRVFQAYPEALFTSDGSVRYDPPVYESSYHPAVSAAGFQAWEVIENRQGRVVVKIPGSDWKTVMNGSVAQLIWDPLEGRTLLIALRDGSLYAAAYPDFTPRRMGSLEAIAEQVMWLP